MRFTRSILFAALVFALACPACLKSKRGGGGGGGPSSGGGGGGNPQGSGGGGGHGPRGGGEGDGDVDDGAERGAPEPTPPVEEPPLIGGDGGIFDPGTPDGRGGFPTPTIFPRPTPHNPDVTPAPTRTPSGDNPAPFPRTSPGPTAGPSPTPGATPTPTISPTPTPAPSPSPTPLPPGTVVKLAGVVPDPARFPTLRLLPVERHRQYGAAGEPTAGSALLVDIESHVKFPRHDAALGVRAAADVLRIGDQMRGPAFDADRFFYLGEGKGIRLANPRARFADVRQYVPPNAAALPQFQTFLADKPERTQVLEIFDHWNAATLGVAAGVEMSRANPGAPASIHLSDLLPLTIYATSTLQAIRHADPNYFRDNPTLKDTYKMFAERAMRVLAASAELPTYREEMTRAVRLMHSFTTSPERLPARQLLVETYGAEWARRVFGIDESQNNRR